VRITSVSSTYCFVTIGDHLAQVVRVTVEGAAPGTSATVGIEGRGVRGLEAWHGQLDPQRAGQRGGPAWAPSTDPGLAGPGRYTPNPDKPEGVVVELPILVQPGQPEGTVLPARAWVEAGGDRVEADAEVVVREPGWRMLMIAHFHYDPVWWNTQAGYTSGWDELLWAQDRRETFQHTGLALVEAHLERARVDARYKFVLAEVDYLKPFWDLYPDRRAELKGLIEAGRLEIVGGTYNEPNTNLTGAETAIRAVVYGLGFQRDVMGADPRSAWQLDVFGHDPQFPGMMAECGLDSSAWARGPFHQWGPSRETGTNSFMQFDSEFEWVSPNGRGLLTSYMPNHYSAGWELERATTVDGAMWRAYELFSGLAEVAATHVTLLPVGTDYTPPSRFISDVAEVWGSRYTWPRFEVGLPREFFDAVRAELSAPGRAPSPQSRDMNPIYTGKDVSFIDTKQAQRMAETQLAEAETMAALASLWGVTVPHRLLDKSWRQLVFGAHHDGITGSESDQVYLDLLAGWRESYELAAQAEEHARLGLVGVVDTTGDGTALVVTNTVGQDRSDLVSVEVPAPPAGHALEVTDESGGTLPVLCEAGDRPGHARLRFMASAVPGIGYRTFRLGLRPGGADGDRGWEELHGTTIANEYFEVTSDPQRGGGLASVTERSAGYELIPDGEVGNELVVYPEYPDHPRFGEGPWNLLPSGPPVRSRSLPAVVRKQRCELGERLIVDGRVALSGTEGDNGGGESFQYRQVITVWRGTRRVDLRTELHGWTAKDRLVRLRFPTNLAGATPVSAVGDAVVARGFGLIDVDSAEAPWTLDNPAAEWFGLSTTLVVEASDGTDAYHHRSVGVAEVVTGAGQSAAPWARELVVALIQKGVTATCSEAQRNRYGALSGDSNLPDFRIAVGGPGDNPFVAELLDRAGPAYRAELDQQLQHQGWARLLVPPERPLAEVWQPNADLRDARALPVLVVAGADHEGTATAATNLALSIASGRVVVEQPATLVPHAESVPDWTAALVNMGTPGFAVDSSGALYVSLLRACSGWPSGVWIDPPRRFAPDGSAFELEHWSHVYEHSLLLGRGDWRQAGCVEDAQSFNRPLVATAAEPHPGALPPSARLVSLTQSPEGKGKVVLAVLKPTGHHLASSEPAPTTGDGSGRVELSLRYYEAHGHPVEVGIQTRSRLEAATQANLLEEPREALPLTETGDGNGQVRLPLGAGELATVRLVLAPEPETSHPQPAKVEPAQPVFSRYWLHNKGAAPMGNQALAVHVLTTAVVVRSGDDGHFTAQVSSGSAHGTQAGQLELIAPPDWEIDPPSKLYSLAAGAFVQVPVRFRAPADSRPGRRFLAARVVDGDGQVQEDVVTVDVLPPLAELPSVPAVAFGHPSGQLAAELEATVDTEELVVPPGAETTLGLRLANRTSGELRAEVQLLSPVETWPWIGPWVQGVTLGPGQERRVEVAVRGPRHGGLASWALFKVTYFGRLWYSPSVLLVLGQSPSEAEPSPLAGAQWA
jgi:alpha-mannosidase